MAEAPLLDQETFDRWCEMHGRAWRWLVDANEDDLEACRHWLAEERR